MSSTDSDIVSTTAPHLTGVWVFDPTDPGGSERNFPHADARTETITPESAAFQVAGRLNPVIEFGESTVVGLALTVLIPFDDDHDGLVQWWRDAAENRRALCYRDNRSRLYWVALPGGVQPSDVRVGTTLALSLQRVDFDEAVL